MVPPKIVSDRTSPYSNQHASRRPVAVPVPKVVPPQPPSASGVGSAGRPGKPPLSRRRKIRRVIALSLVAVVLAGAITAAFALKRATGEIIVENTNGSAPALSYNPGSNQTPNTTLFQRPGDGRLNIVIVGVGGAGHAGGGLTDSIQVASLDRINKTVTFTSVPRDLYVKVTGYGWTKINGVYQIGEDQKTGGAKLLKQTLGDVLGVTISNFALIDFKGAVKIVDAVGGIEVTVPKAINDPFFPDANTVGYAPFQISAGKQRMNGATALKYARSRETTSDFDRSARQQLILEAIKQKAVASGLNPIALSNIISAVGSSLRTDLQQSELLTVLNEYRDSANRGNFVLDTSAELGLLTSETNPQAGYISYPAAGQGKYTAIQNWFQKNTPDPLLTKEAATIAVSGVPGTTKKQLQEVVDRLTSYGFTASLSSLPTVSGVTKTTIISRGTTKPISRNYLSSLYPGTSDTKSRLPETADLELIYASSTK